MCCAYISAFGVTSEIITKMREVATIEPPPKMDKIDCNHIAFIGRIWGRRPTVAKVSFIIQVSSQERRPAENSQTMNIQVQRS